MYFCDVKEVTSSPQGENSSLPKIVTLIKLLFCYYFCDMKEVTLSLQGENSPFRKIVRW